MPPFQISDLTGGNATEKQTKGVNMRRRTRIPISIGIPLDLLAIIDDKSNEERLSRSEYIVGILQEKLADCEQRAKRGNFSRAVPFSASNQEADCEQRAKRGNFSRAVPFSASNQEADCEQRAKRGNVEFSRAVPFSTSNYELQGGVNGECHQL